ncbi:hypothetical protein HDE_09921 [Halotydeus destructor]|nr:hypothetical protein HDE_09921 [Halotydeus destructor]
MSPNKPKPLIAGKISTPTEVRAAAAKSPIRESFYSSSPKSPEKEVRSTAPKSPIRESFYSSLPKSPEAKPTSRNMNLDLTETTESRSLDRVTKIPGPVIPTKPKPIVGYKSVTSPEPRTVPKSPIRDSYTPSPKTPIRDSYMSSPKSPIRDTVVSSSPRTPSDSFIPSPPKTAEPRPIDENDSDLAVLQPATKPKPIDRTSKNLASPVSDDQSSPEKEMKNKGYRSWTQQREERTHEERQSAKQVFFSKQQVSPRPTTASRPEIVDVLPKPVSSSEVVTTQSVSSRSRTVETVTYQVEKAGVVETLLEQKITIQSDGEPIDHDKALAEAIQEATMMNPDMTVEKIEIQQSSTIN